jgi:hypothetical protein
MKGIAKNTAALLLIAAMTAASLLMWAGIPLGWLYIGSQTVDSSQPSMGPYMLVAGGILVSVILDAMLLSRLNRRYQRVTGTDGRVRVQLPWMKSMRGERETGLETTVLDVILVVTVALAGLSLGLWFALFAGSPLG